MYGSNKVRKMARISNGYNQAPHLIQDTNGKVTTSRLDITNESYRLQTELKYPSKNRRRFTQRYNMTKIIYS